MPDWAIVLIAAFGGALAGAVSGPVVAHFLQGIRSKQAIREGQQRRMRRMLERELAGAADIALHADEMVAAELEGHPQTSEERSRTARSLRTTGDHNRIAAWQPERIDDAHLQHQVLAFMTDWDSLLKALSSTAFDAPRVRSLAHDFRVLCGRIRVRMDKLHYPEADD